MNYIKLNVRLSVNEKWTESDAWIADIFKDALIACGYDSFSDNNEGFEAYCPEECFALEQVKAIAENEFGFVEDLKIEYDTEEIEQKDWNAEWEKNYPSVLFPGFCVVRPPFNPLEDEVKYDILND